MFSLNESHSYYLCCCGCDMRKGLDALCGVVRSDMGRDPLTHFAAFLFKDIKKWVKFSDFQVIFVV
jgi:hypothetical protein